MGKYDILTLFCDKKGKSRNEIQFYSFNKSKGIHFLESIQHGFDSVIQVFSGWRENNIVFFDLKCRLHDIDISL